MSILTLEEIPELLRHWEAGSGVLVAHLSQSACNDYAETLAAYAEVVQKVAEMEDIVLMEDGARLVGNCMFCGGLLGLEEEHEEDCPYLQARKLRGLE